jgi:hypothetical protein
MPAEGVVSLKITTMSSISLALIRRVYYIMLAESFNALMS